MKYKKLKASWNPQFNQDFDAITTPNSLCYNKEYTESIIKEYGSVENYKKTDEYKEKCKNDNINK